jgi:hypothetical protein
LRAALVDFAGEHALAGAARAENQHIRRRRRGLERDLDRALRGGLSGLEVDGRRFGGELAFERADAVSSARVFSIFANTARIWSGVNGFGRKSNAPRRIASTAVAIFA